MRIFCLLFIFHFKLSNSSKAIFTLKTVHETPQYEYGVLYGRIVHRTKLPFLPIIFDEYSLRHMNLVCSFLRFDTLHHIADKCEGMTLFIKNFIR